MGWTGEQMTLEKTILRREHISKEITVCPYCMDEVREGQFGCCGESSGHFERAYVTITDETYLVSQVSIYVENQKTKLLLKDYLGDGVYAAEERGMIRIWTTDGISEGDSIYLEPEVLAALNRFAKRIEHSNKPTTEEKDGPTRSGG